jgi:hypothetical protein
MAHVAHGRTVAPPDDLKTFVAAVVAEIGPKRAAERLGISRAAVMAVALGAPVLRGTLALVREAKGRVAA